MGINKFPISFGKLVNGLYNIDVTIKNNTMTNYSVTNIEWCVDEEYKNEVTLPLQCNVFAESEDDIADALSDEFGFLVESFTLD